MKLAKPTGDLVRVPWILFALYAIYQVYLLMLTSLASYPRSWPVAGGLKKA